MFLQTSLAYIYFDLWMCMFTFSRHLLCTTSQLSQLLLHSCNEICCTGISPPTKLLLFERSPQPPHFHHIWGGCLHRQSPMNQAKCSRHTKIQAQKDTFSYQGVPKQKSNVITVLDRLILFQSHKNTANQGQVRIKIVY